MTRSVILALSVLLLLAAPNAAPQPQAAGETFRFAGTPSSFGGMQRNDMVAALKAWSVGVTRDLDLGAPLRVEIYDTWQELVAALDRGEVEGASMTAEEFVRSGLKPPEIFIGSQDGVFTKECVVIARRGSGVTNVAQLQGKELALHNGLVNFVALPWFETLLADRHLARSESYLKRLNYLENPSKCILRVFFGQSAACLVGVQSFGIACELNPQLKSALVPIATSPPLIPSIFFFRPTFRSAVRPKIEDALARIHTSVAGRQVLLVFMSTRFERKPIECFEPTRALIERYIRATPAEASTTSSPSAPTTGASPP